MTNVNILNPGAIVRELERDLGVPAETIALALDVDRRTVERWRTNRRVPQGRTRDRLAELVSLRDQLLRVFGTRQAVHSWLVAESRHLGGLTPAEALRAGRLDRVRSDLEGLEAGIYL